MIVARAPVASLTCLTIFCRGCVVSLSTRYANRRVSCWSDFSSCAVSDCVHSLPISRYRTSVPSRMTARKAPDNLRKMLLFTSVPRTDIPLQEAFVDNGGSQDPARLFQESGVHTHRRSARS